LGRPNVNPLLYCVENKTNRWQNVEKGIVTGCTISPNIFVMGMNLIIRTAERETRGPKTASGIRPTSPDASSSGNESSLYAYKKRSSRH